MRCCQIVCKYVTFRHVVVKDTIMELVKLLLIIRLITVAVMLRKLQLLLWIVWCVTVPSVFCDEEPHRNSHVELRTARGLEGGRSERVTSRSRQAQIRLHSQGKEMSPNSYHISVILICGNYLALNSGQLKKHLIQFPFWKLYQWHVVKRKLTKA